MPGVWLAKCLYNFIYPVALWFKHMPGASLCAMASPVGGIAVDPEGSCPVLKAWSDIDSVVARAAAHSKLTVTAGKLTRQTCIDNADVLVRLINATGGLPAFGLYQFVTVTRYWIYGMMLPSHWTHVVQPCNLAFLPRFFWPGINVVLDIVSRFLYWSRPRGKPLVWYMQHSSPSTNGV